jgi:hypothetical protein
LEPSLVSSSRPTVIALAICVRKRGDRLIAWTASDMPELDLTDAWHREGKTRGGFFRAAHKALAVRVEDYLEDASIEAMPAKHLWSAWYDQNHEVPSTSRLRSALSGLSAGTNNNNQESSMSSFGSDPTVGMVFSGFTRGSKIVASAQTMQVCRKIAVKVLTRWLPEEHHALLDHKVGIILVDLITPAVIHALAERGMVPGGELVGAAAGYAFEGAVIRHGLDATDMLGGLLADLQGELGELAKLASMFSSANMSSPAADIPALPEKDDLASAFDSLEVEALSGVRERN